MFVIAPILAVTNLACEEKDSMPGNNVVDHVIMVQMAVLSLGIPNFAMHAAQKEKLIKVDYTKNDKVIPKTFSVKGNVDLMD